MERKITHKLSYHSLRPMGDRTSDTTLLTDIVISSDSNIARYINEKKIDTENGLGAFVIVEQGHSIFLQKTTVTLLGSAKVVIIIIIQILLIITSIIMITIMKDAINQGKCSKYKTEYLKWRQTNRHLKLITLLCGDLSCQRLLPTAQHDCLYH